MPGHSAGIIGKKGIHAVLRYLRPANKCRRGMRSNGIYFVEQLAENTVGDIPSRRWDSAAVGFGDDSIPLDGVGCKVSVVGIEHCRCDGFWRLRSCAALHGSSLRCNAMPPTAKHRYGISNHPTTTKEDHNTGKGASHSCSGVVDSATVRGQIRALSFHLAFRSIMLSFFNSRLPNPGGVAAALKFVCESIDSLL